MAREFGWPEFPFRFVVVVVVVDVFEMNWVWDAIWVFF